MFRYQKNGDLESGATSAGPGALYPGMQEPPEMRWALIRKIYIILSLQMLLTAAVAAVVVKVRAIPHFFTTTSAGLGLYIFLIILPFIGELRPDRFSFRGLFRGANARLLPG
jgi:protein lifeguard